MKLDKDILLARLQGKGWTEIGEQIGMSRDAVRRRMAKVLEAVELHGDAKADPTNIEVLRLERELAGREELTRQLEQKIKALHKDESVFQGLAHVIRDSTEPLPFIEPDVDALLAKRDEDATPVDMVVLLSDEHADLVITKDASWGLEQYDFGIFRCRLQTLFDLIVEYVTVHLPRHAFVRLWVFKLGDAVNGDIHDAGPKNYFRNTLKAALAVGDVEAQFVQGLIPHFPGGIVVVGISGNHPRRTTRKDYQAPHDNYDFLVGVQMATRLHEYIEAGVVTVILPDSYSAYVEVRGKVWALNHGDEATSYTGLPWVGFDRRNNRVQALLAKVDQRADYFAYGHYHTAAEFSSAGARSYHAGGWFVVDPYALNKLALGGDAPTQTLYVQSDKHGIILPIPIYTKHAAREAAFLRGEWEPQLGRSIVLDTVSPPPVVEGFQLIQAP